MYNPFKVLVHEHEVISNVASSIGELEEVLQESPARFEAAILALLDFFREYSDKFHHHKEELVLFPAMNNHPDFMQQEIIEELEDHHVHFRQSVAEIEAALKAGNHEKVLKILKLYVSELLDHIAIENDELFIMAESLFSENELEKMYFRFEDLDNELGTTAKKLMEQFRIVSREV